MSPDPLRSLPFQLGLAVLALLPAIALGGSGDRLIEAVQAGDVDLARDLLAEGADIDATSRYGATPLFFACDKANLELVEMLLEKGATVDVTDTFYGATPLTWTLYHARESEPHRQVLFRLLEAKPETAGRALPVAAELGDEALATAVIATGKASTEDFMRAVEAAEAAGHENLARALERDLPANWRENREEDAAGGAGGASDEEPEQADPPAVARAEEKPEEVRSASPRPWPAFRGANADGNGDGQGVPWQWDAPSGTNVRWKTPIPGLANSSPVVWGDRVFVTTATTEKGDGTLRIGLYGDVDSVEDVHEHAWEVHALDLGTGEVVWRRVASVGRPKVKRHLKSTHANPTPATDGRHLVAGFGSEGVYCYDFDGNLLWRKDLGVLVSGWFFDPTYEWGFASSPILHEGRVILQVDVQEGSYIAALDVATGRELWKTDRDEIPTWGTPTILPAGSEGGVAEIVTNGTTVRGYDAATGELLWWLRPNSEITVASPIAAAGLAFVTGGYPPARPIYAIRPGSRGDLSLPEGETASEAIAWSVAPGGAYMPTPLAYRGILYVFHNNGRLAAYEATTGRPIYKKRVGEANSFSASPVAADGRIFFTAEQGETFVVRAGPDFEVLGVNTVGEPVMSTPAISRGLVAIRARSHVYGIGGNE